MKTKNSIKLSLAALVLVAGIAVTGVNAAENDIPEEAMVKCQAEANNAKYPEEYYQECIEDAQRAVSEHGEEQPKPEAENKDPS